MSDSVSGYDSISTDFLVLVGRIVIGWSRIERAIDIAVSFGKALVPNHFKDGKPPFAFKGKVKALRAICKELPAFAKNTSWIDRRLDEVLDLAEDRHTIVHGFFHGISGEPEPQIYFRRAPPLSGDAGERLIATRVELEIFVQKLRQADHDFMMVMLLVNQDIRGERRKTSKPPA